MPLDRFFCVRLGAPPHPVSELGALEGFIGWQIFGVLEVGKLDMLNAHAVIRATDVEEYIFRLDV